MKELIKKEVNPTQAGEAFSGDEKDCAWECTWDPGKDYIDCESCQKIMGWSGAGNTCTSSPTTND